MLPDLSRLSVGVNPFAPTAANQPKYKPSRKPKPALVLAPAPPPLTSRPSARTLVPRSGNLILGDEDQAILRTDQDLIAGYALFCYKRSWDKAISYEYRGVPTQLYVEDINSPQDGEFHERRVPGLLMFLPMPMLRKMLLEFV